MREMGNACKMLLGKSEWKKSCGRFRTNGRLIFKRILRKTAEGCGFIQIKLGAGGGFLQKYKSK